MRHYSFGIRARLLLLVAFAVIPAFGLIGYTALNQRHQAAANAATDTMNLVRLAAMEQSQLIASTRQLLVSLSQLPSVTRFDAPACDRVLAELQKPYPYYANLGAATPKGNVFCSALPLKKPVNIADRSYFRRAMHSRDLGIGDYQTGRITHINSINFGYPVIGAGGKVESIVYAALDLAWLNQLITNVDLPAGSTLTVVDSNGTILTRFPDPQRWSGKSLRSSPLVSMILAHRNKGTDEMVGLDGVYRLYAYAPLYNKPDGNVYVSVGTPTTVAFAAVQKEFERNMSLLALVALLALAAAWIGGEVFVLRNIQALADAARRLGRGDLSTRTGLAKGNNELAQLARVFDDMAFALQRIDRALKTSSAGNRAVVRAQDEQALLDQMCRIIVGVGGYRYAWVGYAEQDERKTVRAVAQAGFEGGLEALAEALVVTWSDSERGRGPVGTAIRTAKPYVAQNVLTDPGYAPWRSEAHKRGYASMCSFPLPVQDKVIGALAIYSDEPDAFNVDELELLAEATEDLAFGIASLRIRAEREQAHETIKRMAYYDSLTGLPNHVYLDEWLRTTLTGVINNRQSFAVILIDLDRFREINDALGFHQGDALIREISARLRRTVDEDGMVTRMRGDEFAAVIPVLDAHHAAEAALRIMEVFESPFAAGNLTLHVTATMGISLFPQHGGDAARLIRHADVAKHQAKKSGKQYALYTKDSDEDNPRQLALAGHLRQAIEENGLTLHYQPKIDMRTGCVCGVEALARWFQPEFGFVPPDKFIPLAEHTGLIKPLTDWVISEAARQSCAWRREGLRLPIAVNLSARNLRDADLVEKIEHLLTTSGNDAACLGIEITETAVMEDPDGALAILKRFRELGIALFIDDFGIGHSSLGYLKKLPVDAVKIDKSFVMDMIENTDSAAIVRSTILLAHDLNLKVVAEGIESRAIWEQLAALHCDTAQGYHICKPLPAEQLIQWLQRHPAGFKGSAAALTDTVDEGHE